MKTFGARKIQIGQVDKIHLKLQNNLGRKTEKICVVTSSATTVTSLVTHVLLLLLQVITVSPLVKIRVFPCGFVTNITSKFISPRS